MDAADRTIRGSWKLTFVAWSGLLLVWSIVTVALDEDNLRLLRRLGVERSDVAVLIIALVIVLPLAIDVTRNLQRTYRLWKRRAATQTQDADWRASVPAYVPRRFRHDDGPELTRRERAIVEQGQLIYGTVEHHGELTSVRATTEWGQEISSRPVVISGRRPREGARSPLLFETGARVGVAPELHDLLYYGSPAEDRRPPLCAQDAPTSPAGALRVPVHATLHPVHRVSGARGTDVGELTFDGDKLTLQLGATEPSTLRLSQPFRVELSSHLLPDGRAELNLAIEQRAHGAYRAGDPHPLCFKTELDQNRISRRLPLDWADVGYLPSEDFERLWPAIVAQADDVELASKVAS